MLAVLPSCGEFRSLDGRVLPVNAGNFAVLRRIYEDRMGCFFLRDNHCLVCDG